MAVLQPAMKSTSKPHVHVAGEQCPLCEQAIPNERYEEITKRIAAKERERQTQVDAKAKAEVEAVRRQSLADVNAVRTQSQLEVAALRAQSQAAIDAVKAEGATREAAAVEQGRKTAEAAYQSKLAEAAEAAKTAKERQANLQMQLDQSRNLHTATVEKLNSDFAVREAAIRTEAQTAAETTMLSKVSEAEQAKLAAQKKVVELEAAHEATLNARLIEQREALDKSKTEAVNLERSKAFDEKLKLESLVEELQRKLQNKTADELGEGAELNLFDELKAEFPNDDIRRVGKGKAGADIIHKVQHNGQFCGCIIYDSKNHQQWRTDHVTKLRDDQIAAKAEHAVLSTHAFPKEKRQLHIESGVILAQPARAVVIAIILRKQLLQLHSMRVSSEERVKKADELYEMITSVRFNQFLDSITKAAEELEAFQLQERKVLEPLWKKQGERIRAILRSRVQLSDEVERIIGIGK